MRGVLIEYLQDSKPDENKQEWQKTRSKCLFLMFADRNEKSDIYKPQKDILTEEQGGVVTHKFADEILEEEPNEKEVKTGAPVAKDRDSDDAPGEAKGDINQGSRISGRNFAPGLPSYPQAQNKQENADHGLISQDRDSGAAHIRRHSQ